MGEYRFYINQKSDIQIHIDRFQTQSESNFSFNVENDNQAEVLLDRYEAQLDGLVNQWWEPVQHIVQIVVTDNK